MPNQRKMTMDRFFSNLSSSYSDCQLVEDSARLQPAGSYRTPLARRLSVSAWSTSSSLDHRWGNCSTLLTEDERYAPSFQERLKYLKKISCKLKNKSTTSRGRAPAPLRSGGKLVTMKMIMRKITLHVLFFVDHRAKKRMKIMLAKTVKTNEAPRS